MKESSDRHRRFLSSLVCLLEGLPFLSLPVRLLRVLFDASVFPTKHGHRHDSGFGLAADLVYFHCGGAGGGRQGRPMTAHGPNNLERWSIYTATFLKKFGSLHGKQSTGTAVLQESEEEKKKKQASPRSRRSRICLSLLSAHSQSLLASQSSKPRAEPSYLSLSPTRGRFSLAKRSERNSVASL